MVSPKLMSHIKRKKKEKGWINLLPIEIVQEQNFLSSITASANTLKM